MDGVNPIATAMDQIQAMASEAAGDKMPSVGTILESGASSGEFASLLQNALHKVSGMQNHAAAQAKTFELGGPVALNDVMIDGQKANIAFQEAVEVRNKLATAYTTIMQMSV